jgi:hypothetical protein
MLRIAPERRPWVYALFEKLNPRQFIWCGRTPRFVVPANAGTQPLTPVRRTGFYFSAKPRVHGVWIPAFAGTTRTCGRKK